MKIQYWDAPEAHKLTETYNQQVAGVPHCYSITPDEFVAGFPHVKFNEHYHKEGIHSQKLIVAIENHKIIGFADTAIAAVEFDGKPQSLGYIRFITYRPGCRPAGQALLAEAEKYISSFNMDEIKAFRIRFSNDHCGYRFYHIGYNLVSDRMTHVCALLEMNGYIKTGGEIFMNWPDYMINEPQLPDKGVEIRLEVGLPKKASLPGLDVKAFRDGDEIGACESTSIGEFCNCQEANRWNFIEGLFVNDQEQGKGLGRYLLMRNIWEMKKYGYKNTSISTDWENSRALLFYINYGYRIADTTYEYTKKLT